jgi:hypothetical protein
MTAAPLPAPQISAVSAAAGEIILGIGLVAHHRADDRAADQPRLQVLRVLIAATFSDFSTT